MNESPTIESFYEFHVSPSRGLVRGCLLANLKKFKENKISLKCSNAIDIKIVKVNNQKAFFSRSYDQKEKTNLHIYIPNVQESTFWSPVPKLTPMKFETRDYEIIIIFEVQKKNPSLIVYNNFICTSNYAYDISGWMPFFSSFDISSIKKFVLKADKEGYIFIGPCEPSISTSTMNEYDLSLMHNQKLEYMGWAIGEMKVSKIFGFHFLSIDQFDPTLFSFLEKIHNYINNFNDNIDNCLSSSQGAVEQKKLIKKSKIPFLVVRNHFVQMEITTGFFILSANMFNEYYDFPFFIPISSSFYLVTAVSYALAFDIYGRRFNCSSEVNWLLNGIITYSSRPFIKAALGSESIQFYEWMLIKYLDRFSKCNLENHNVSNKLKLNFWEFRNPARIKSQFIVHLIASFQIKKFSKPNSFPDLWPDYITKEVVINEIQKFTEYNEFKSAWISQNTIPYAKISLEQVTFRIKSIMYTDISCSFPNVDNFEASIPGVFRVFHSSGILSKPALLNITSKPTKFSFETPKKKSKNPIKSNDGLYWISFESKPALPMIKFYNINDQMLFNIIKNYNSSLSTQHDALQSIELILNQNGDDGNCEKIKFLGELLNDSHTFYTLKCHAVHILGTLLNRDSNFNESSTARKAIINFFSDEIVDIHTTKLQDLKLVHPLLVLSTFQTISKLFTITDKYSSFNFLQTAMIQLANTDIGPGIVLCFLSICKIKDSNVNEILPHIIGFMRNCSGNPPLMTAAVRALRRFIPAYEGIVLERLVVALINSLLDHLVHFETRLAIAELLLICFTKDSITPIMSSIKKEFETSNPSYTFINGVLRVMNIFVNSQKYQQELEITKTRYDLNLIYNVASEISMFSTDSFTELHERLLMIFHNILTPINVKRKEKQVHQIPDGIIYATPYEYGEQAQTNGMFSDSD